MLHLTSQRAWIALATVVLILLFILAAWAVATRDAPPEIAADLPTETPLPVDIAETPLGTFKCRVNSDCPADQWCYVTNDFAGCTKK